jgi:AraC family transcriptional regulator
MQRSTEHARIRQTHSGTSSKADDLLDVIPQEAGPRLTTFRGGAAYCVRPSGAETFLTDSHFVGILLSPIPGIQAAYGASPLHKFDAPIGGIEINPALMESRWIWQTSAEYVKIGLPAASLLELAEHELGAAEVDLHPVPFGTVDQKALHIARMLQAELERPDTASELYVDSLITLFGIHLLRTYTRLAKRPGREAQGTFSPVQARRVQEFLQENYSQKVSVADLAAVCDLSVGYFIKLFTKTFGQSPHQYLLNLRLASAERLLVESDLPIPEIAYASGFASQSHLTESMRKNKQTTPAKIRRDR